MKKAVGLLAVLFVLLSLTALSENGFAAIAPGLVITNASFVGIGDEIAAVTDAKDTLTVSGNAAGVIAGFYCDGTGVLRT